MKRDNAKATGIFLALAKLAAFIFVCLFIVVGYYFFCSVQAEKNGAKITIVMCELTEIARLLNEYHESHGEYPESTLNESIADLDLEEIQCPIDVQPGASEVYDPWGSKITVSPTKPGVLKLYSINFNGLVLTISNGKIIGVGEKIKGHPVNE